MASSWSGNFLVLDWHIGKDQGTLVPRNLPQLRRLDHPPAVSVRHCYYQMDSCSEERCSVTPLPCLLFLCVSYSVQVF